MNLLHLSRSCSLWPVNSLIIHWNHFTYRDTFCLVYSMRKCENSLLVHMHFAITIIVSVWDICETSNQKFWKSKQFLFYLKFLNVFFVKIKFETALIVHTLGWPWYAVAEFLQFAQNFFCFLPDQRKEAGLLEGRNGWRRWWCRSPLHSLIKQEVQHGGRVLIWRALT